MIVAVAAVPGIPLTTGLLAQVMSAASAGTVSSGLFGAAEAVLLWLKRRTKDPTERYAEAVSGEVYRRPLLVVLLVVVALQVIQFLVSLFVGFGVGVALSPYGAAPEEAQSIAVVTALFALTPVVAAFLVLVSRVAAYRLQSRRFAWLALAIALNLLVNLATGFALLGSDAVSFAASDVIFLLGISLLYLAAAAIGVRWANRTDDIYRIGKAFLALPPDDRRALVDLTFAGLPDRPPPPR
jgi:hypothetical protein